MGIVKTKNRARTSFFWLNLNQDIENCLSNVMLVQQIRRSNLLNDSASTKPWTALAMDNFELNSRHYLIIVDHFSKFTVVKKCNDLTSKTTINILLEVFSEHGIPSTIRCDHGCNFVSSQFIKFTKHLNISITLSSAFHHSSNPAECAVKTVKSLMRRCFTANMSCHITLLEYLSTPLSSNIPSPSELMGRQFRGLLPFFQDCSASESIKEQVLLVKEAEKQRFDKMAHDLPVIPVSATVSYMNKDQKTWSIGKVESCTLRSYVVLTEEGHLISHNHVHLCCTNVPFQPRPSKPDIPYSPILPTYKPSKDSQMPKPDNTCPTALPHTPAQSPPVSVSTPPRTELRPDLAD